jgi:hypothetical protein
MGDDGASIDGCLCRLLDDHESFDDPWEDLTHACPAYQAKMRAVARLRPAPGQSGLASASLRCCPSCGAWYCYTHSSIPHSDHDRLELDRLPAEARRCLEPLVWSEDEETLRRSLAEAFSHADGTVADCAAFVFDRLLDGKFSHSDLAVRLLAELAVRGNQVTRRFACVRLAAIAKTGGTWRRRVADALAERTVDPDDAESTGLAAALRSRGRRQPAASPDA